ncbi:MAG: DUF2786 domain-containing protein [Desulfobacterales bacterium]
MVAQIQAKLDKWGASLEHRILKGLSSEWEAALWVVDEPIRRRMKKPLFSLGNMTARYGSWSLEKREIRISRHLVEHHPWDAVRDVLRHEMAHQMADEVFAAADQTAHGPLFQDACRLLRANPKASGTYPTAREMVFQKKHDPSEAKLRQVKKLLALAQSRNRHEAAAAMKKAHELIAKHHLIHDQNSPTDGIYSIFLGAPLLRRCRDVYFLANMICEFYFVEGIWVPAFVVAKGKMGSVLEISGTAADIQMADYVYHYVRRFIDSQWDVYKAGKNVNRRRKTDFAVGIIEGFTSTLRNAVAADGHSGPEGKKDLVVGRNPRLAAYIAHRYPRIRKIHRNGPSQDARIMKDGVSVGKTLVIFKGIHHRKRSRRLLPEN